MQPRFLFYKWACFIPHPLKKFHVLTDAMEPRRALYEWACFILNLFLNQEFQSDIIVFNVFTTRTENKNAMLKHVMILLSLLPQHLWYNGYICNKIVLGKLMEIETKNDGNCKSATHWMSISFLHSPVLQINETSTQSKHLIWRLE